MESVCVGDNVMESDRIFGNGVEGSSGGMGGVCVDIEKV